MLMARRNYLCDAVVVSREAHVALPAIEARLVVMRHRRLTMAAVML